MECKYCGYEVEEGAKFCPHCGNAVDTKVKKPSVRKVTETINSLTGEEGPIEIHFKDLFTEIFKKHTRAEMEDLFICGTEKTTPSERSMIAEWPKPWLHTRVFICLLAMTVLLFILLRILQNALAVPSLLFVAGLLIPFSLMIFFWECNVPRNISFFECLVMFFLGGICASVLDTILEKTLFFDPARLPILFNVLAALFQVIPVIAVTLLFVSMIKPKYLLNGLCIGACVGAGFGMLLLAGRLYWYDLNFSSGTIYYDAVMAGHFVDYALMAMNMLNCGAMIGAGLTSAMEEKPFTCAALASPKFLAFAILAFLFTALHYVGTYALDIRVIRYILLVVMVVVVLIQISAGLKQCVRISGAAWEQMSAEAEETEEEA